MGHEEQSTIPGLDRPAVDNARDRKMALDRTPIPVASQILEGLQLGWGDGARMKVLDVGCGEGAWGVAARRLWPNAEIIGIEPRIDAMKHAGRNYDEVFCGTFQDFHKAAKKQGIGVEYDLVMGNPPFSAFSETGKKVNLFPELVEFAIGHLRPCGTVCFYGLNDLGQRGQSTRDTFEKFPPSLQLRVSGSISHRGPKRDDVDGSGQGDSRCYSGWVWCEDDLRTPQCLKHGWTARNLPLLPACYRRWVNIPGSETE